MNSRRYLLNLPAWVLLVAAFLAAMAPVVTQPSAAPHGQYVAEAEAIVRAEIAREAKGQPCVAPATFAKAGTFPSRVLVSEQNADLTATSVESMTFDQAWAAAEAGRVTIRCAIA